MSGLHRYFVTGFSPRLGYWVTDSYECMTMEAARRRFQAQYPTLKNIKIYPLRTPAQMFE